MQRAKRESGIAVLDRALDLLREAGAPALLLWALATLPFLTAFLYFLYAMSSTHDAEERLPFLAALVALSYVWMKGWQTQFGLHLRAVATAVKPTKIRPRAWTKTTLEQLRVQPGGFVLLPLSLVIGLPFAWVYAYFQSLSMTGDRARAQAHALDAPKQNHQMISIFALLWTVLTINLGVSMFLIPDLLKRLFGIETTFSQAPMAYANSTTFAVVLALSYFLAGPVIRAAYVLRCLDTDSQTTAEDLLAQLPAAQDGESS